MNEMTITELRKRLEGDGNLQIVDIREPDEYQDWHIHSASNVPVYNAIHSGDENTVRRQLGNVDQGGTVVAVCRRGNASKVAAEVLESMGHEAFSLTGGMHEYTNAWSEATVPAHSTTILQIRRNGKGCLSYLVARDDRGVIIDPCMDENVFVEAASRAGVTITHVLETHVHADHISRARELASAVGAKLCIPRNKRAEFEYESVDDGDTIQIGSSTIHAISTPGHTAESMCYLVDNEVLISGDTLFAEAIGRPDLEKGDAGAADGARALYGSLHDKIMQLDGNLLVCPGHTSESIGFDGKPLCVRLSDALAAVDLLSLDKAQFIETVTGQLGAKPPNFERVLAVNEGRAELGFLDPLELEAGPNRCAVGKR